MALQWTFWVLLVPFAGATNIELAQCDPPDEPEGGGYGPQLQSYIPGDMIHYYCEVDTFIGGNFLRKCEDTGSWSGDTPVCDASSAFKNFHQSSTKEDGQSDAEFAKDGERVTCSSTKEGERGEWKGTFEVPGELIRVMLFFPKGPVSFEVILVRQDGSELVCGAQTLYIDRYEWIFQNCPGPNNRDASGVKIRSLSDEPLRICEIQAYVLTSPKCTDPHVHIEHGHLILDRHRAVLQCDKRSLRSRATQLDCIREGVWNWKKLNCSEPVFVVNPNNRPKNPDTERERLAEV